jgi:hypothetical protein
MSKIVPIKAIIEQHKLQTEMARTDAPMQDASEVPSHQDINLQLRMSAAEGTFCLSQCATFGRL